MYGEAFYAAGLVMTGYALGAITMSIFIPASRPQVTKKVFRKKLKIVKGGRK